MANKEIFIQDIITALGTRLSFTEEQKRSFAIAVADRTDFFVSIWSEDQNFTQTRNRLQNATDIAQKAIHEIKTITNDTGLGDILDIIACGDTAAGDSFKFDDTFAYLSKMESTVSKPVKPGKRTVAAESIATVIAKDYRAFLGKRPGSTNSSEADSIKSSETPFQRVCRVFTKHYGIEFSDDILHAGKKSVDA